MKHIFITSICFLLFAACSDTNVVDGRLENSNDIEQVDLAENAYYFASTIRSATYDSINCKLDIATDCGYSDIAFLRDSTFLMVGYCMGNKTYHKGKYHVSNGKILLQVYSKYLLHEYNMAHEVDTLVQPEYLYSLKKTDEQNILIDTIHCKRKMLFYSGTLGMGDRNEQGYLDSIKTWFNADSVKIKLSGQ